MMEMWFLSNLISLAMRGSYIGEAACCRAVRKSVFVGGGVTRAEKTRSASRLLICSRNLWKEAVRNELHRELRERMV